MSSQPPYFIKTPRRPGIDSLNMVYWANSIAGTTRSFRLREGGPDIFLSGFAESREHNYRVNMESEGTLS